MAKPIDEALLQEILPGSSPIMKFRQSGQRHVWRCATAEGKELVVKVSNEWHETQARQAERILKQHDHEIRAMQMCDSPHLARLLDVGTLALGDGFVTFYQTEMYVPGSSLHEHIARWKLSSNHRPDYDMNALATSLAAALKELHRHNLVHRDIKPLNIIVRDEDGLAVVIDLGIVFSADFTRITRPEEGSAHTPAYQSPEQARRQRELGWESDLFCAGLCLYEAATGQHPFPDCSTEAEYCAAIIGDSHAELIPNDLVSPNLCKAIDIMLQKFAYERFATPDDLIAMLSN
ncbi:MAG: protein kinase [Armatimonadia bacterium]